MTMNHLSVLQTTELFRNVSDEDLARIAALCQEKRFAQGDVIIEEGSSGNEMYIIPGGLVGIDIRVGENLYRQRSYEVTQGDVFGELALFGHRRTARVRALSDVVLLEIPCSQLTQLMREVPRIGYYVMNNLSRILAERLMMANITMQDVMSKLTQIGR